MRPLSGCDHRVIGIRICGDRPVGRSRTNILPDGSLLDFWMVNVRPFLITVGTTSFERDILVKLHFLAKTICNILL
jgi:hypothetical protein